MHLSDYREYLAIAVDGLSRYKLRTALSVLGIVLGIAATIAMMSVSEGARRQALRQVEALGLDNLIVRSRVPAVAASGSRGLFVSDTVAVRTLVPGIQDVAAVVERRLSVNYGGRSAVAPVLGADASFADVLKVRAGRGRMFTPVEARRGDAVCVLGALLAERLFGRGPAVGAYIRLNGHSYKVLGVLAADGRGKQSADSVAWRDIGDVAVVPLAALSGQTVTIAPGQPVDELWVRVHDPTQVAALAAGVAHAISRLNRDAADFDIVVPRQLLAQRQKTQQTFSVVIGSVGMLALLVGGIGIMNVMLTSVVERTHEIGLRRTVGATKRAVLLQFLLEALMMTLGGGTVGIVAGVVAAYGITAYAGWPTYVSVVSIMLAFSFAFVVGVTFGSYPASQAARLEPVDALRHE